MELTKIQNYVDYNRNSQGLYCNYKRFLFENNEKAISFRNSFISKIIGRQIMNSYILEMFNPDIYNRFIINMLCKTDDNKIIKVELAFDDKYEINKIKAIYYTSKFIEDCYRYSKTLIEKPELYQIRFSNYEIFNDKKIVHNFYYSDYIKKADKKLIKISFVEFPKLKKYLINKNG